MNALPNFSALQKLLLAALLGLGLASSYALAAPNAQPPEDPANAPEHSFEDDEKDKKDWDKKKEDWDEEKEDWDEEEEDWDEEDEYEPSAKETWAFIEKVFPPVAKRIGMLKKDDHEDAGEEIDDIMDHFGHVLAEYYHLAKEEPNMAEKFLAVEKMDVELHLLAETYHESENAEKRAAIKKKFRATAGKVFDARIAMEREHVKRMQEEIKAIQAEIEEMAKHRDEEIEEQMDWLEEDFDDEHEDDDEHDDEEEEDDEEEDEEEDF